jgi:AcrR family transcriptional regulator
MTSPSVYRKERERLVREDLIISKARHLLLSEGFQGFSLDDVAKAVEYSKGTIYLHFRSKEDLGLAVVTASLTERAVLFERALQFQGNTRERMRAIGFACCHFMISNPDHFKIEMMMTSNSFWDKASEERRKNHASIGARTFRPLNMLAYAALEAGDLPKDKANAEHVSFAIASITVGSHIMTQIPEIGLMAGVENSVKIIRQNQDFLLDGFGWKPLFSDFDYAATDRRIHQEIFPEASWHK